MARQRKKKGRDVSGWIILDKPAGMGSTQAISKVKWLFNAQKAGHAGTLDPLASGMLPIALPQEAVDVLMKDAEKGSNARLDIDLENQTVTTSEGESFSFEVDPFRKHCLLEGLDDIGLTLEKAAAIDSFEVQAAQARPWV